jgi:hypothetical protein
MNKMAPMVHFHRTAVGNLKMKTMANIPGADSGRIEQIIRELERLQKDANGIVNTYVDYVAARTGNSYTATKAAIIFPLGSQINFPAALRLIREELVKSLRPRRQA